jgi:hypothetical protein
MTGIRSKKRGGRSLIYNKQYSHHSLLVVAKADALVF